MNPILNYYSIKTEVSEYQWKAEKKEFLPKINLAYAIQSIDGISGFSSWQVGVSMPLLFLSQSGKSKAAHLNYQINNEQFIQKNIEIKSKYKQLLSEYFVLLDLLDYYKTEALPLAAEQIKASNIAYRLGSVNYNQFIQNIEAAIDIKKQYLTQQQQLLQLAVNLKFIVGK